MIELIARRIFGEEWRIYLGSAVVAGLALAGAVAAR